MRRGLNNVVEVRPISVGVRGAFLKSIYPPPGISRHLQTATQRVKPASAAG